MDGTGKLSKAKGQKWQPWEGVPVNSDRISSIQLKDFWAREERKG